MNKKKVAGALGIAMVTNCIATPSITVFAENINQQTNQQVDNQNKIDNNQVQNKSNGNKKDSNLSEKDDKSIDKSLSDNSQLKDNDKKVDDSRKNEIKSKKDTTKTEKNINNSDDKKDVVSKDSKELKNDSNLKSSDKKESEFATSIPTISSTTESPLDKSSISVNNVWWQHIGDLTFNSKTMKLGFSKSWAETNPYANKSELLFSISLINKDGTINKAVKVYGGGLHPEEAFYNELNNLSFEYGDKILIEYYKASSKLRVNGLMENGTIQKPYNVNKRTILDIEKTELSLCTNEKLKVDSLPIEGASNKVTSCTVKGLTTPESNVTVFLDGKKFTGKSNYVGTFEVPVNDENGIKGSTAITVCVPGQAPVTIYPTQAPNLGISKASIVTSYNDGLTEETIKFDAANFSIGISESGTNQFAANLINNEGKSVSKAENAYFNGFSGENNLNGANFKYGNILSIYQSKKSQINWNNPTVNTGKDSKTLEPETFYYYRITVDGLSPVSNSNLTVNSPSYDGDSNVDITGTTIPNTDVTVSGGTYSIKVKSDSKGNYVAKIPEEDVNVGDVISVYVNNDNFKQVIYNYSPSYALGNSEIQVSSQYTQPIFYIGFSPESNQLIAAKNIIYNNYSGHEVSGNTVGTFYTNRLKFNVIDPKTGENIYNISTTKLNDSSDFVKYINGKKFSNGDIIELSYNPALINIGVTNGKTSIGDQELGNQYFEITDKGLVNVSNKFVSIDPVNVLGAGTNSTTIQGTAKPNESVNINVDGKNFSGKADSEGKFSIQVTNSKNFTSDTKIVVSSEGYIPTTVKLGYESSVQLQNSHINFYNNSWSLDAIQSSIGFDVNNMKFTVQNYVDSFGNGKEKYFTLGLYGSDGKAIINPTEIKNGATGSVSTLLNEKSFEYGDIISLSYNSKISIPTIINGNNVLGNIDGNTQYFEITKTGLVRVNFGDKAYTNNVSWNNGALNIEIKPASGNNINLENSEIEIVDSSNNIVATGSLLSGKATIEESALSKLKSEENYVFKIKLGNSVIPLSVSSNVPSNGKYNLFADSDNNLCIKVEQPKVNINNANDIKSYSEVVNDEISKNITSNEEVVDALTNEKKMTDIIANAFINRFGLENIQSFYSNNANNTKFISWLLNNDVAMSEYLQATNIKESNIKGLQIWSDIWNKYTNSRYGFNLKLAIATALATQTSITDCFNGKPIGSSVERYNIFENLNSEGGMVQGFDKLNVKMLVAVVNVPITNPQIRELRALVLQNHNNLVSGNHLPSADYTINYNFRNPYNGASIFGTWQGFYGEDETVADVFKIGGVCGSISRLGSVVCRVFGQPAHQMGEPGHDAFYYYNIANETWSSGYGETVAANATGFDVSNWSQGLALNGNIVTYTDLYTAANNENLVKSNEYLWLASASIPYNLKLNAINEALKVQPLNVEAWLSKIDLLNGNPNVTAQDYIDLSNDLMSSLKGYPEPMFDLLVKFNRNMIQICTTSQYNDFVNKIKNILGDVKNSGNSNQKTQANRILNDGYLEKYGFVENQIKILGKININSWKRTSPTDSITFRSDGKITVDALHTWIGTTGNSGITIKTFSSNMEPLKTVKTSGTDFGTSTIENSFNNTEFKVGEIIEIIYKPGVAANGYLTLENNHLQTFKVSNTIAVQLTNDGLKVLDGKYTALNGKEYNFSTGFVKGENGTKYEMFGEYQKGFQYVDNKGYYFNDDCLMETGLQNINNNGYYFNDDGVLQTGWQTIEGDKYYFSSNGEATPGYQTIYGEKYLFANNGLEIKNIIPNSEMKVSSYSTEQNNTTYSANNIIDGKLNDNWQNIWNRSDKNPYITIELDHSYNINQLVCFPRQDGNSNGDIEKYKILVSMDGKNFKEAASGNWVYSNSKESQFADLQGVKAKYIKIESEKGVYDLATIAEVVLSGTDVNKTNLENEITKGKARLGEVEGYTQDSINNLSKAISAGENGLNNKNITQEEVNTLTSNIENAIDGLKADKTNLQEALNKAKEILKNPDQYIASSIKALSSFVTTGESVMNNTKVTPVQVKAAAMSILSGINSLEANKTSLQEALSKANEVLKNSNEYTAESIKNLNGFIKNAESVMNNTKATPEQVKNSALGILSGISELKANKTNLQEALNKANEVLKNSNEYTADSIKDLNGFVTTGESIMKDTKATPEQVKTSEASLLNGISELKANLTDLNKAINNGMSVLKNEKDYTKDTVEVLNKAVLDGENISKKINATPQEVSEAQYAILNAINGLKKLPVVVKPEDNSNTDASNKDSETINKGNTDSTGTNKESGYSGQSSHKDSQSNTTENNKSNTSDSEKNTSNIDSIENKNHDSSSAIDSKSTINVDNSSVSKPSKQEHSTKGESGKIISNSKIINAKNDASHISEDNTSSNSMKKKYSNNIDSSISKNETAILDNAINKYKFSATSDNSNRDEQYTSSAKGESINDNDSNAVNVAENKNNEGNKTIDNIADDKNVDKETLNKSIFENIKDKVPYGIGGLVIVAIIASVLFLRFKNKKRK